MTFLERSARSVSGLSATTFALLSAARRARFFHPVGRAFRGTLTLDGPGRSRLPEALKARDTHDIVLRFSRGAGLPQALPDVLGLAMKIRDAYGPGKDQDWLMVTSGRDSLTRHALLPALDFTGRSYSTVAPYRSGGRLITFGAESIGATAGARTFEELEERVINGGLSFSFEVAEEGRPHEALGSFVVTALLGEDGDALRFNPWNTHADLKPAGALNELRRRAYPASQEARPDTRA